MEAFMEQNKQQTARFEVMLAQLYSLEELHHALYAEMLKNQEACSRYWKNNILSKVFNESKARFPALPEKRDDASITRWVQQVKTSLQREFWTINYESFLKMDRPDNILYRAYTACSVYLSMILIKILKNDGLTKV